MVSLRSRAYLALYVLTAKKRTWTDPIKLHRSIRRLQRPGSGEPPAALARTHRVQRHEIGGTPAYTVRPAHGAGRRHVLYLHGGAYVHPPEPDHWRFAGTLASRLGCSVTLPLYPLAPDRRWDSTLPAIRAAYDWMAATTDPADRVVMGESAGGGMTLVLAQELRAEGRPQPRDLVLISPWLDITASDPEMATLDRRDPYLSIPGLVEAGRLYAGTLDRADPRLSPINGGLEGLGRVSVFIGSRDVLYADARRLHTEARRCGVDIGYFEYEDMFHAWVLEQSIPEARHATRRIVEILRG